MTEAAVPEALIALILFSNELLIGLPQPLRIRRVGSAAGVSPASTAVLFALSLVWFGYALFIQAPATAFAACGAAGAIIAVAWWLGSVDAGAAVVIVAGALGYGLPQLWIGLHAPSVMGLSTVYLWLHILDAVVFGVYGVVHDVPAYVAYAGSRSNPALRQRPARRHTVN